MRSAIRQSLETQCFRVLPSFGGALVRATRPDPWRPHNDLTKSVFIHIPRTAGGSISKSIYGGADKGHMPARVYKAYNAAKFSRYFAFAFVRNPFDRFVSAYHRALQNPSSAVTRNFADQYIRPFPDFEKFVEAMAQPAFAWRVMGHPHFAPQAEMVSINGQVVVDYVGHFERLGEEYSKLVSEHFPLAEPLGVENKTPHEPYSTYYTPKSRDIVERLYSKDLAFFGYSFS